jgi:hypothetical protein
MTKQANPFAIPAKAESRLSAIFIILDFFAASWFNF